MKKKELVQIGRKISFMLRHSTQIIDSKGWADINTLLKHIGIKYSELMEIVETNDKHRYELSSDKRKIRAIQGHSVDVDVELEEATPTMVLYHGTSSKYIDSILKNGILPHGRLYVHLTSNKETAFNTGKRHGGETKILELDVEHMIEDEIIFYHSRNNVWLTKFIDTKYIINII